MPGLGDPPPSVSAAPPGELHPRTEPGARLLEVLGNHVGAIASAAARHDRDGSFPFEIFDALAAAGVLGATVPVELGGMGLESVRELAVALNLVARADASTALALHMQLTRGVALTGAWRSEQARPWVEALLRGMARGQALVCAATAEPGHGYAQIRTELVRSDGSLRLSGRKSFCTLASAATHFTVRCRVEEPAGSGNWRIASALVDRDAAGLRVAPDWDALGMRASGSTDVAFDGCPVAAENVEVRGPWGVLAPADLLGRTSRSIAMLAIYLGIAESARQICVEALRERRGPRGAVAEGVAAIETDLFAMRSTLDAALSRVEELDSAPLLAPEEAGVAAMDVFQRAKLLVDARTRAVVETSMTLVGGAAYLSSHPLSRLYRDARAASFMHPYPPPTAAEYLCRAALGLDAMTLG